MERECYLRLCEGQLSRCCQVDSFCNPRSQRHGRGSARKVDFYTRQFVDALSPSNFVATNPEVLTATLASGGQNLLRGLENLLADLERGNGRLAITMTDLKAFRLGENIATT